MDKAKNIIRVRDLCKIYKLGEEKVVALNKINLDIEEGEICCIFGTSGSGKSTFLNMISGMEKPSYGSIRILGKEVAAMNEQTLTSFRQKYMGMIFQSYNLMQGYTATENVAMPLMFSGMQRKQREQIAKGLLERVGLEERTRHYPNQMSGGQQQRVGIARAYANRPRIILADEPTGNLDSKTTEEVMDMIVNFSKEFNQTVVIVTHDPEMEKYVDRIIHMKDGNIIEDKRV